MDIASFQEHFRKNHEWAKGCRASGGFKEGDLLPHVLLIDPEEKMLMIAAPWRNHEEKKILMHHVWMEARKQKAIAVIITSDARQMNNKAYCAYYGIPMDQFDDHRAAELRKVGGSFGDLPKEVWRDCIMSASMSPTFPNMHSSTPYVEGPEDSVVFEEPTTDESGNFHNQMMKPWWDGQPAPPRGDHDFTVHEESGAASGN